MRTLIVAAASLININTVAQNIQQQTLLKVVKY